MVLVNCFIIDNQGLFIRFGSPTAFNPLKLKYKEHLLQTIIPASSLLNEATFYGKPLCLYKINSLGATAYLELAVELIQNNLNKI